MARKVKVQDDTYSPLEMYCIGLNEYYKSLRRAGFSVDHSLYLVTAPQTYPATILPSPNWLPDMPEYYDDEDED